MSTRLQAIGFGLAAVAAGVVYIIVHESRRKHKASEKRIREQPITKEMLLKILHKAAEATKPVVEKIRVEVQKIQVARNMSDEQALVLFQQNFEHSLDQLIGVIRAQYKVSEKAMDSSFKEHQADPDVQAAIQNMRVLSNAGSSEGGAGASSSSSSAGGAALGDAPRELPKELTKELLKEVMTFNAVTLEKELKPIKDEVARIRRQGKTPQVDPQVLMSVQMRISEQVKQRYGLSDEQVMAAVDKFSARSDKEFAPILQRIATTLSTSLS